jgi:hypothetical protein
MPAAEMLTGVQVYRLVGTDRFINPDHFFASRQGFGFR